MSHLLSGSLLAASMFLGQPGEPPANSGKVVGPTIQQSQPTQRPILGWFQREDRPVLNRIQSWFKRDQPESPPQGKFIQPKVGPRETDAPPVLNPPPVNDFPRKLPNPSSQAPSRVEPKDAAQIQQASLKQADAPAKKSPISPLLANRIGRDEKFEWITGQLEIENGNYVLYYATPETVDQFHGRIVLAPEKTDMSQLRRGDLVSVRGQLIQRLAGQGAVPIYRVTHASMIERPKAL